MVFVFDETMPFFITSFDQANNPCSTIQALMGYLSMMRPGRFSIASLDQTNNPCRTIQASVGHLSLMIPGRSFITLLDQQSLSQA